MRLWLRFDEEIAWRGHRSGVKAQRISAASPPGQRNSSIVRMCTEQSVLFVCVCAYARAQAGLLRFGVYVSVRSSSLIAVYAAATR